MVSYYLFIRKNKNPNTPLLIIIRYQYYIIKSILQNMKALEFVYSSLISFWYPCQGILPMLVLLDHL